MAKRTTKKTVGKKSKKKATKRDSAPVSLEDQLQAILEKPKSANQCLKFFEPLTEKQRRQLAPHCIKWMRQVKKNSYVQIDDRTWSVNPLLESATISVFWTANASEIKKLGRWTVPSDDHALHILSVRKPSWTGQFAEDQLGTSHYWGKWKFVRELIKRKLCKRPDNPRYYTGMITGIVGQYNSGKTTALAELEKDPALLKDEVWRLFEYEGDAENTLAKCDSYEKADWSGALVSLSKSGKLSRAKLLDAALSALQLGFNHFRSKWFFDFFDLMEPTAKEIQKRSDEILVLLSSQTPNVAKWAFAKVEDLIQDGAASQTKKLIPMIAPLLTAREKGTVISALRLLEELTGRSPKLAGEIALTVTDALGHEKADVQKSAFASITKLGDVNDAELIESVERYVPIVAASLKKKLNQWLESSSVRQHEPPKQAKRKPKKSDGKSSKFDRKQLAGFNKRHVQLLCINELAKSLDAENVAIPAVTFDGTDIPRLDPERRITPINDLEELIDTCARVIEDDSLVDDGERAIDGLARLCDQRPEGFDQLTGPVFKRATKLTKRWHVPFTGRGISADLCGLIRAWVTGKMTPVERKKNQHGSDVLVFDGLEAFYDQDSPLKFFSDRAFEVSMAIADQSPRILLSTPTHEGGWIEASEFVKRINSLKDQPTQRDVTLAILRLAPDGKRDALRRLKTKLTGEWLNAAKYALGGDRIKIGKLAPLWVAAARSRAPFDDDQRVEKAFPKLGPDCGLAARFRFQFPAKTFRDLGRTYTRHYLAIEMTEKIPKKRQGELPTLTLLPRNRTDGLSWHDTGESAGDVQLVSTIWPVARESFFAVGSQNIGDNLDWWEAAWHFRAYLEPLIDSDTPLKKMGMFLLLTGLAAKEPGEHGLASDATIAAINDGRLGTDNLAEALTELIPTEHFNLSRWAKRFEGVAAASNLHAYVILRAFDNSLSIDPKNKKLPRGLGDILEMLSELAVQLEIGISNDELRKSLAQMSGSSKVAKAAGSLLEIETTTNCHDLVKQAINSRTERLRVWKKRM